MLNKNVFFPKTTRVRISDSKGLYNVRACFFLLLWYIFSGFTLFLNKYVLSYMNGDPTVLGTFQMLMTTICGFIQLYFPCGIYNSSHIVSHPPGFFGHMIFVGCIRFVTVLLGLISINYVAVSFTETVKSSAPIFTVLISRILLGNMGYVIGETSSFYVNLSLLPIMGGLALCSVTELSFNLNGFIAALATNFTECLQNVYSKMLLSGELYKFSPAELQFYSSLASFIIQIPSTYMLVNMNEFLINSNFKSYLAFILNGIFFHFQTITAYVLMEYISPVTHSVANTVKRALLIWISIIFFGNSVTFLSGFGTIIVIVGVLCYNKAQEYDKLRRLLIINTNNDSSIGIRLI